MLKYAHAQIMTSALAPTDASARELRRFAHRHHFDYDVRPGYLYVRSRAISSRCNDNHDEFPAEELEKSWRTFIGKPVFVNHNNEDHRRARGVIIDAALHKDSNRDGSKDYWVELLHEIDALRFPKLAQEIINGNIARTSMGCDVAFSVCSACNNKATTPAEYCAHIPASKGMMLYRTTASGAKVGELIRETCFGLKFFENSLLVEPPADPTAHFLGVDTRGVDKTAAASGETAAHAVPGQASPRQTLPRLAQGGQRTASLDGVNANKDPRFEGVSLKEDQDGWYVTTHRARSDSYPTPEDIPQSKVDFIESTGAKTAGRGLSWDEVGERHPQIYGDPEIHENAPEHSDGNMIGWAANDLAHSTPDDPDAEQHDVSELTFHHAMVSPHAIDHKRHERGDYRVQEAAQGYRDHPEQMPPVVLVHRHGVLQPADGHHRAEGAKLAGVKKIPAYVAKSPFPDTPSGWGGTAPYHGARATPFPVKPGKDPGATPEGSGYAQDRLFEAKRITLAELMAEGVNQEGGELPAFPWDKAPKINLPMTQKGWDDPRRKTMYDAKGERDAKGPQPAGPFQSLIDKLPDHATQELTNPHGMGAADVGRTSIPPDKYPGDKKEQWVRHRWDNVKWPSWTDHADRPSTPTEIASSKRNIRNRWSKTWKRPLACDHPGCPPWEHEGDPRRPTAPQSASGITMSNGHPLDPFEEFMQGPDEGTSKEGAAVPPEDHPWFKETGLSHHHILDHWDAATPEEKAQGKRWYPDAHLVAKSIAKLHPGITDDKEAAHKGAGVLSAYSPQQGWWANQHNAARSFHEQRALGKGEGTMIMSSHAVAAQKILDGMPHNEALRGPKTQDFASLIEHGGHKPQSDEDAKAGKPKEHSDKVVVDRHALSVAAGRRLNADDVKGFPSSSRKHYEVVANHYRKAAAVISDREGREVPPHEVQAVTWLARQRLNAEGDTSPGQKGRNTVQRNQRTHWQDDSRKLTPDLHDSDPPNSHVSRKTAFGEQKAPADVDTLREDACPVCGDRDTFDGATCQVCGYVAPPKMFQDPDLEKARQMDLRKDIAEFQDPSNPMAQGQVGPDGQPIGGGPMDPAALDENGMPVNPDGADPNAQPGSLPGEVQAEVQPGGPMDPQMLGPDGMPIDPQGDPNELGAPVDPAMLGPDGQPLQQPGQQMMVGPNGEPLGPQELPPGAVTDDGKPFTPGPNAPMGPGDPQEPEGVEGPEGPLDPDEMGSEGQIPTDAPGDGQIPAQDAGQGAPGTPGDGVPDLQCPACGFTADATNPVSVDMNTSIMPPDGMATPDGVQAGDVCPNCGAGQLMSPAEMQGQTPPPVPV